MEFGAAVILMNIPSGTRFGGFWRERPEPARGTHDPLTWQALAVSGPGGSAVLLSADLQLISRTAVREIARALADDPGLGPEAVLVHATHDHAAPGGDAAEAFVEGMGDYFAEPAIEAEIVRAAVAAARTAWRRRAPGTLAYAAGAIAGIGRLRSDAAAPARAPAALLRVEDDAGRTRAALAWYGCHASVLGIDNDQFSADHPGVVRTRLAAAFPGAEALYFNAPAADVSTRNTRREQTFAEMERLGGQLAQELLALGGAERRLGGQGVAAAVREVRVPVAAPAAGEDMRHGRLYRRFGVDGVPFACQALRIGDLLVVGLEAEIGFALGQEILERARAGGRAAIVVAPAGGSVGNVPSRSYEPAAGARILAGVDEVVAAVTPSA